MRIIYKISEEEANKIAEIRKTIKNKMTDKKLYAVELRGRGKTNPEIAEKLDTSPKVISKWVSTYKKGGVEALFEHRKGGNHRNMSYEEEKILSEFSKQAEQGKIVEVSEIRKSYDKAVGHETKPTQIYAVLKRHKWTKKCREADTRKKPKRK